MALPRVLSVMPVAVCVLAFPAAATAQGSISGTVVFEAPGVYQPVRVEARDPYQGDASWGAIASADSDGAGAFVITGLAPGAYRVYFNPLGSDRAFQWYPNKVVPSETETVTVIAGTDTPLGEVSLGPGYTIEGQVSLSPVPPDPPSAFSQIWINAQEASTGEWVSWGQPDASGHYARSNLPAGHYILTAGTGDSGYIRVVWPDSIYSSGAMPVPVNGEEPTASAAFTLRGGRTISGHVSLEGTPLPGASVNAWIQGPCCFDQWSSSDADGFYQVKGLPQGTYELRVQGGTSPGGQPYTGKRYNNRSSFDLGDSLVVAAADIQNVDFSVEAAQTIEGTVCLDTSGSGACEGGEAGLSVGITAYRASDGACCEWSGSDGEGHYRIAVGAGHYKVEANPPAHLLREYWQNRYFLEEADVVTVASTAVTGIDLSLREGSTVGDALEGRVVGADGTTGIPGVDVQLTRWSTGSWVTGLRTGLDGSFHIPSLPAGLYRVNFDTGNSNRVNDQDYVSELWTKCQVTPGDCPEGVIDPSVQQVDYPTRTDLGTFQLSRGGSISGTVCVGDAGSSCPTNDPGLPAGLGVNLESIVSMGPQWQGPPRAQLGADGAYRIRGIPGPASYRVRVDNGGTDFSTAYFVSTSASTPFSSLATPVQVTVGGHEEGKDVHLAPGGSISGHVYCGTSEPIPGMPVNANLDMHGVWYGSGGQTKADGSYLIQGLPPGDYQVRTDGRSVFDVPGCPNPANQTYPSLIPIVGTGAVPGVDFHLENGTTVSGNVQYRVAGELRPVVNMRVSAHHYETGEYLSDGHTDAAGDYVINALAMAGTYRIRVNTRDNYLDPQFWNFIQETYPNDYAAQGTPVAGGATGIDFVLELGGAISGRVTAEGGEPLTGVNLNAWSFDGEGFHNADQTDQNGFYVIRGLPQARYAVYADTFPRNYVPEYFDDVVGGDQARATPVTVTTDPDTVEITPNIDFDLAPGVTVRGRVRASGSAVPGLRVFAYQNEPPSGWTADVVTDGNGEYEIAGLFPGTWRVAAVTVGTSYALQQQERLVTSAGFPCTAGDRSDCVDFELVPGSTIHFQAYQDQDVDGTCDDPVPGLSPRIRYFGGTQEQVSPSGLGNFRTDAAGHVTVSGLPAGIFRVWMGGEAGFVSTYYDNAFRSQDADPLDLASGETETVSLCLVRGRRISGRVFFDRNGDGIQTPNGDPSLDEPGLASVCVNARSLDGSFDYGDCTDAQGDYSISGVLPLDPYPGGVPVPYAVRANAQGTPYAAEYFDRDPDGTGPAVGTFKRGLAEPVTVGDTDRTGIDFSLVLGGGVQGTVIEDPSGSFLPGIQIYVNPWEQDADGFGGQTDAAGRYLITGLPPGSYRIQAQDDQTGAYVQEYYDNARSYSQATPVPVQARASETDPLASTADFALAPGGRISGTVKDANTSVPLANVAVQFADSTGNTVLRSHTDAQGRYTSQGLPAGTYYAKVDNVPGHLGELWQELPCLGCNATAGTPITVTVGATITAVDFTLTPGGGSITGQITDATTHQPLSTNVWVNVFAAAGTRVGSAANPDATGTYVYNGLPTGTYYAQANSSVGHVQLTYEGLACPPTCNAQDGTPITVMDGVATTGIDFALDEGGAIAGHVSEEGTGAPLSVTVWIWDDTGNIVRWFSSNADGDYSTTLPPGQYRVVTGWNAPNHVPEIHENIQFNNWPWGLTGTPVTVARGATSQVDFQLAPVGRIQGKVTDQGTGQPIAGQSVCIWHSWAFTCGQTGEDGVYTITSLPAGQYVVFANGTSGYGITYYDGIASHGNLVPQEAAKVTVTAGDTTTDIDFALRPGARIEGTVLEEGTSSPLPNVTVSAYSEFGQLLMSTRTDATGHYSVGGLGAGTFYLRTDNTDGYANECFGGTTCPVLQPADAIESMGSPDFVAGTPVVLAAGGTVQGTDFALAKGGRISGRLTDEQGRGIVGVVAVFDAGRRRVAGFNVPASGDYVTSQGLPTGPYYVLAWSARFVAEVFDNVTCLGCNPATGTPVPVALGQTTPGIDFVLARGGQIAGRVTDAATGKGFPVNVEVWSTSGVRVNPNTEPSGDFAGAYATNGLPAGTYLVRTRNWSGYVDEAYDNVVCTQACIPAGTTAVQVTEGKVTWGVDFGLARGALVTGMVTNSAGESVAATQGQIYDSSGKIATHWGTDPLGRYVPVNSLPPGTYHARTRNLSGYLDEVYSAQPCLGGCDLGAGTPIVVAGTDLGGIDFVLRPGLAVADTTAPENAGHATFLVTLSHALSAPVTVHYATADQTATAGSDYTAVSDTLTFSPGEVGKSILVPVTSDSQCENNETFLLTLTSPSQALIVDGSAVATITDNLATAGSISGTVTDDSASPAALPGVSVCAEPIAAGNASCANTSSDGSYGITCLLPGDYRVRAGGEPTGHRLEYYDDATDGNAATPVGVVTGADRPGIDFALGLGGAISGDVVDGTGAPLPGITFCANPLTTGIGACDLTDSLGHYLIRGLQAGSYRVSSSSASAYRFEYYDNQTDVHAATPVPVTPPSETADIDFVLVQVPRILSGPSPASGPRDQTIDDVKVTIEGASGSLCGSPPCLSVSLGSDKLHVLEPSLAAGVLTFDLHIDADAPLGQHALSVVNQSTAEDAAEDAVAVKANAFEVLAQAGGPEPTTGDRVYVVESATSRIRAYSSVDYSEADAVPSDPATRAIEVCCQPSDIVLSPDRAFAYVLGGDRAIGIVDLRLGREVGRIATDTHSGFHGVAVTASHVYVADRRRDDRILVFDATTGAKVTDVMLGPSARPGSLRLHPGGGYLYVAVRGSTPASVAVIDTTTHTVTSTLALPGGVDPGDFAFRPGGQSALLQAATGTYLLSTTNPANPTLAGTSPILDTLAAGEGMIEVATRDARLLAYIPVADGRVWVADVTTDNPSVLATLTLGLGATRVQPSSDGSKVFVLHGISQDLYAVDVAELMANPGALPATRMAEVVAPTALAAAPIPAAPPLGAPTVGSVSPSSVTNGGADIAVSVSGSNFAANAWVWLKGTMVRGTVTGGGSNSLDVTFPPTTPTGRHVVVVTNPGSRETGLDPAVVLQVDPPAYVRRQAAFNASHGTAGLDVFAPDGSRDFIDTEPFPAGMAITPDGRLGLVNHTFTGPRRSAAELVSGQQHDTALFELDPGAPSSTFHKVVATLPYLFGGFEAPAFTPDAADPQGVYGYAANGITDTVSVVDPATRTEVDVDDDEATQSYPMDDPLVGPLGQRLPGLSRIHLDAQVTDGALRPQGAAITPDGSFLYVSNAGHPGDATLPGQAARVSIVNTETRQLHGELTDAGNGALTDAYSIAIPPTGEHVFVTGMDGATTPAPGLFVYRTGATGAEAFVDRIPLTEVPRGLAVSKDGKTVYVALPFSGLLQSIDVTPRAGGGVEGTTHDIAIGPGPVRGVSFVAVAQDDGLLYASNAFRNEVYVLDTKSDPLRPALVTTLGTRCAGNLALQPAIANPRLDSVTPPNGPADGGNVVVLMGASFTPLSQVRFGATAAPTVLVDGAFRLRAQAPAGSGPVDVTVENPGGATATLPSAYTYVEDTTPPVFTTPVYVADQVLAAGDTVTVTLKWVTDEEATTRIDYGLGSPSQVLTVPGYRTSHTVELTGLTPGATYVFQATSTDLSGNSATDPVPPLQRTLIDVPDTAAPVITDVDQSVTDRTATITWKTNEDATTLVKYDADQANPLSLEQRVSGTRRDHSVTLTNLLPSNTYAFRVLSSDASGNGPTAVLPEPDFYSFTTVCDSNPPGITAGPAVSYLSNNLVIIAWTTDELSSSIVNYGISSLNEQGVIDVSLVAQHVVFLTNLLPGQLYRFQALSTDSCGNTVHSADPFPAGQNLALGEQRLTRDLRLGVANLAAGTTLLTVEAASGFETPSQPDVTPPNVTTTVAVAVLGPDRIQITLGTDEAASILAHYGVASVGEASAFDPSFSQTPSLIVAGLLANTTYRLELVLTDPKGNATIVPVSTFLTLPLPDTAAPVVTNLTVSSVIETGAVVSWQTDEPAESWVRYGAQGAGLTGTFSAAGLNTTHTITLSGLSAGATYAFEARSRDATGNLASSPTTGSFQTAYASPTITTLSPDRGAQGATLAIVVNGSRFDPDAVVQLGLDVTITSRNVSAGGTQLVANVTVGGSAAVGLRQLQVMNPRSNLSAAAPFTVVDDSVPVIRITTPLSGAELVSPAVTVSGTVSEVATVTINGEPVTLSGLDFAKALNLPGPGAHRINVTAVDASGNRASTSIDVKYLTLSVDDATVAEGNAGSPLALFNLNLSTTSARAISVQYETAGVTATPGTDYAGGAGTITIPAGSLSVPVAIAVNGDLVDEDDETFTLTLTSAPLVAIVHGQATGTIKDDDGPPAVGIGDAIVTEGDSGTVAATLTVTLSHPTGKTVTVGYATADGTAVTGADFPTASGSLTFEPLATTKTLTVQAKGDLLDEPDETFFVNLSAPINASLGDAQGQVTIRDDDEGGALTVDDVAVVEGDSGVRTAVFTISLGTPAPSTVTVRYTVVGGTASANDFVPGSGKIVFKAGQSSRPLAVKVKGDRCDEEDETFYVRLIDAQGAPSADAEGVGTISDDDPPPSLHVTSVTVVEGNAGTHDASFFVTLSRASGKPVSVEYATADGTARAGADYVAKGGVLTFAPGVVAKGVKVSVTGDRVREPTERFFLILSNPLNASLADGQGVGTIRDND